MTTALIDSLELPDQVFGRFSNMACPAMATSPQHLILVDAADAAVIPRLPKTPCGDPRDEVAQAITGLEWMKDKTYRFQATKI